MQLHEAMRMAATTPRFGDAQLHLVCSFEALHLVPLLEAHLIERLGGRAPVVRSYGFDQLRHGLTETAGEHRERQAVVALAWDDLHPALSWRSRGGFAAVDASAIQESAARLERELFDWAEARRGAESVVMLPPRDWFPLIDETPRFATGRRQLLAETLVRDIAGRVMELGVRIIAPPDVKVNLRSLLWSGTPLDAADASLFAKRIAEAVVRTAPRLKALVVDLDNTLWNGVIGEDGPEAVSAKADGAGFPYRVFQHFLRRLKGEGVLLAFCSRNNEQDVLPVFDSLDMPLRLADFAAFRCNWGSKSSNIRAIVQELNVGLDATCFVDDNPVELEEVARILPEITVRRTPTAVAEWQSLFTDIQDAFWTWRVGAEDRMRTESLRANARRTKAVESPSASDSGDLAFLELELDINAKAHEDPRSLELLNKTNQFNLTGRRLDAEEWLRHEGRAGAFCASARLRDQYGDFGTIAVVFGERAADGELHVENMVLSCRAFGRAVEWALLDHVVATTAISTVSLDFVETGRNVPAKQFLDALGASADGDRWRLNAEALSALARSRCSVAALKINTAVGDPRRRES